MGGGEERGGHWKPLAEEDYLTRGTHQTPHTMHSLTGKIYPSVNNNSSSNILKKRLKHCKFEAKKIHQISRFLLPIKSDHPIRLHFTAEAEH